jgi:hypothetical protein
MKMPHPNRFPSGSAHVADRGGNSTAPHGHPDRRVQDRQASGRRAAGQDGSSAALTEDRRREIREAHPLPSR